MRALWAGILELPLASVGADCHFLQLGGDSLHWTRMAAQLERLSGSPVPSLLQVEWATPRRCAEQWLEQTLVESSAVRDTETLDPCCFPATSMQRGIWFAQQLAGDEALYAGAMLLHLSGSLDVARMQKALLALLAELPLLRARFRLDTVSRRLMVECPDMAARATTTAMPVQQAGPDELHTIVDAWLTSREGHGSPAPFRSKLLQSAAQRFHLILQVQHLISDGWSGNLLVARLASLYQGEAQRIPDHGFARHAWRLARNESDGERALSHWRARLADFADAQRGLFLGKEEPQWPYPIRTWSVVLPAGLRRACEHSARARGTTPFVLCLAACKLSLARLQGEARQVLALPRALRGAEDEDAIGCFVALQLSASCVPDLPDPGAFLRDEARRFAEDCRFTVPIDSLSCRLAPARLPDGNPWSTVLMAFQNFPQRPVAWAGLECRLERLANRRSQYGLALEFMPTGPTWCLRIEYAPALFDSAWLDAFHSGLLAALEELAD